MPTTIKEIIKNIDKGNAFEIICINNPKEGSVRICEKLPYWKEYANKKWYSEEEVFLRNRKLTKHYAKLCKKKYNPTGKYQKLCHKYLDKVRRINGKRRY